MIICRPRIQTNSELVIKQLDLAYIMASLFVNAGVVFQRDGAINKAINLIAMGEKAFADSY